MDDRTVQEKGTIYSAHIPLDYKLKMLVTAELQISFGLCGLLTSISSSSSSVQNFRQYVVSAFNRE